MNWTKPATRAESLAYEALRKEGSVVRKRDGDGYLYAPASEFEDLAAEVHADLLALRAESRCDVSDLPTVACDCYACGAERSAAQAEEIFDMETGR